MPDEQLAGQDTPTVYGEVRSPEVAGDNAATTEPQTDGGEGGEGGNTEVPDAKTFTQQELDEIVKREKAKAEAKAERRVLKTLEKVIPHQPTQQSRQHQQTQEDALTRREGESESDFVRRVVKAERESWERETAQASERQKADSLAKKTNALYAEAQKVPGFDREAFDELPLTPSVVRALVESDHAAKLMAFMASNPDEVARIVNLSEARQAAEVGKLEARLAATPTPKPSKAPNPIKPVGGGNTPVTDLTSASMDDYIAQRRKQGAAWAR